MLRTIGAAIVGYLAMMVVMFILFMLSYQILGEEGAFRPDVYDVSTVWIALSIVVAVGAAVVGGYVAALVSRNMSGPRLLAGLVLLIGLGAAAYAAACEVPDLSRPAGVGWSEAMQNARNPVWLMFLNPLVSAGSALLGGRRRRAGDNPTEARS